MAEQNLRPILRYITPDRNSLLTGLALTLLNSALALVNPWIAGQLTGSLAGESTLVFSTLTILTCWFVLLMARSLVEFHVNTLLGSARETVTAELRSRLHQHMQLLPYRVQRSRKPGTTLTLLSNDAELVSSFFTETVVQLLPSALTLATVILLMLWLDPVLALAAMALVPFYWLCIRTIGRRIRPLSRIWLDTYSELVSRVEENIRMLPAIKAFGREQLEITRFEGENQQLLSHSKEQARLEALLPASMGFLAGAGLILLLGLGALRLQGGHISLAELVTLLLYALLFSSPLRSLAGAWRHLQHFRAAAERILEFLGIEAEPFNGSLPDLPKARGAIEFHRVRFSHESGRAVLDDLDLVIKPGETVAVTGTNGAGKTTLAQLLMRFSDPDAGWISIDGHKLQDVSLASLRRQVRLLDQHTLLLNASVAENIGYGCPDARREDIEKAARAAQAHEFICALPQAYATPLGEQGNRLSGGQRQRIALARTLLQAPNILVLDEATAMLDPRGESDFLEDCRALFKNRTVLMITHRTASLALADRVVKLENGKILDPGEAA